MFVGILHWFGEWEELRSMCLGSRSHTGQGPHPRTQLCVLEGHTDVADLVPHVEMQLDNRTLEMTGWMAVCRANEGTEVCHPLWG